MPRGQGCKQDKNTTTSLFPVTTYYNTTAQ